MKNITFLTGLTGLFFLLPLLSVGQDLDSLKVAHEVDSLFNINRKFAGEKRYVEALEVLELAKNRTIAGLGTENVIYANCLFYTGWTYHGMFQYRDAEPYYMEAKAIQERVVGKEQRAVAVILNSLGVLYLDMGELKKAEENLTESVRIAGKILGNDNAVYMSCLNNLGRVYEDAGNMEKAEQIYRESKDIRGKKYGNESPQYVAALINLANLCYHMGNYAESEHFNLEAKSIAEKVMGKNSQYYMLCIANLAGLYMCTKRYVESEEYHLEANSIMEKSSEQESPNYISNLDNLANLYYEMKQFEKAEPLYLQAKALREKVLGKEHPMYATSLYNIARLYMQMKRFHNAEPLFLEALELNEKILGKKHLSYVKNLIGLGDLYRQNGYTDKVEPLYLEANTLEKVLIANASKHLSEKEMISFNQLFTKDIDRSLSLSQVMLKMDGFSGNCFDNALFYKGFMLQATNRLTRLALTAPATTENMQLLVDFHNQLSTEYAKPITDRNAVDDLETKANDLEKELVRTVAGYGEALQQVTWQEVQATLTQGEVAVEFVRYHFYRPEPTDSIMYAALVLKSGNVPPVFVPLFEEKELTQITGFSETNKEAFFHQIYAGERKNDNGKSLRDLIYAPLEAALSGVSTIYYAPDGLIHRINPDAIYLDEKATFADRFRLVRVNSTRQLVIPFAMGNGKPAPALIYGGIDYDADSTALLTAANIQIGKRQIPDGLGALNRGGDRGGKWRFLTNSEKEARAIEALFDKKKYPVSMLTGKEATEESLRAFSLSAHLPSPRVLHLATHGFFFPDPAEAHDGKDAAPGEVIFKENENPMLRAGLVMAGGNHAWLNGKAYKGLEDGILTAYEVSQLDLRNTELVTLSACETGLGEIVGNEGVFGLQRAFKIAGAHYIIMSLWKVPDQETQELMTLFYKKWLEGKMAIPDAFRSAQTEMRKLYPSPYYWAGFVLVE